VIRALERACFVLVRVTGSHHLYEHPDRPDRQRPTGAGGPAASVNPASALWRHPRRADRGPFGLVELVSLTFMIVASAQSFSRLAIEKKKHFIDDLRK
jgi:hypothetical protein